MEQQPNSAEELNKNIIELTKMAGRLNSLPFIFLRGIVNGVGTFIGATIVAAIAITVVVKILGVFNIDLGIREYLNSLIP